MLNWLKKHAHLVIGLAVLVIAVGVRVEEPQSVVHLRTQLFDSYQRWQPRGYLPTPVRIIDIDDESLERLGPWPWPRTHGK